MYNHTFGLNCKSLALRENNMAMASGILSLQIKMALTYLDGFTFLFLVWQMCTKCTFSFTNNAIIKNIDLKKIESLLTVYTNAKKHFEEKCDASIHAKSANRSLKSGS